MKDYYKEFDTLFSDDLFLELSKRKDRDEIEKYILMYPEKRDIIINGILLVQYLELFSSEIPDKQINESWYSVVRLIARKKALERRKRLWQWSITSVAVSAVILLFLYPFRKDVSGEQNLLPEVENTVNTPKSGIQIIHGSNESYIADNATLIQTEEGDLLIGEDQAIEFSDVIDETMTVVVPKGKRTTIKFRDGSTVWVNSDTKIIYPKDFGKENREIRIEGEAYLKVTKSNTPFIVHTNTFNVRVLGTEFNVSAYSSDCENSVVLVNGSVEVITSGSNKEKLRPNQGFFSTNGSIDIKNVDVYSYTCWKDGVMKLSGESLYTIMRRLSRYYGVEIQCTKRFESECYQGKIELNDEIEMVLDNIALSTPFNYTRKGKLIQLE